MVVWLILADTEGRTWLWRTLAVKTGAQTNHFATRNLVWFYFFTNNLKSIIARTWSHCVCACRKRAQRWIFLVRFSVFTAIPAVIDVDMNCADCLEQLPYF